jgi:hypothetical protein
LQSLRNPYEVTLQLLRNRRAIASKSSRNRLATASQSLHNRFAIALHNLQPHLSPFYATYPSPTSPPSPHHSMGLRGFYLKSGQFLGTRHDFMPPNYTTKLCKLYDDIPPIGKDKL